MNSTNIADSYTNQEADAIQLFTNVIGYYSISIVSFVGFILNIFLAIILKNKKLDHAFYKYLFVKACIDSCVCLIGIGYLKSNCAACRENVVNHYYVLTYQWYAIKINMVLMCRLYSV